MNQEEFRARFRELPDLVNPKDGWDRYRQSIRIHARNEPANEFIKWSTVQATMFVGNAPHTQDEVSVLQNGGGDWERWEKAVKDPGIGTPIYSDILTYSSGQYIHQAYLINYFERMTALDIASLNSVVELGAGYGSMRVVLSQLGFRGQYFIYDLPEMLILQEYYLERVLSEEELSNTFLSDGVPASRNSVDLVLGITSVSEMPIDLRNRYFDMISGSYYFFVAQPMFYGVWNEEYFSDFADANNHLNWDIRKNPNPSPPHDFITGWPK